MPIERLSHGTVLLADTQLEGRGQYQRKWLAEPGKNLTFTVGLIPGQPERLPMLTLSTAFGLIRGLHAFYHEELATEGEQGFCLKWPNDILRKGKKIAGILTESVFNGNKLERVLIGIGLNVNQESFPPDLDHATSLHRIFGSPQPREELLGSILKNIEYSYRRWHQHDKELIKDINQTIDGFASWGEVEVNGEQFPKKVKLLGINESGHLLILTSDFEVKTFTYEQVKFRRHHRES